ncbi:uncharacterized protein LOC108743381 [Agrilus planipennis]|uniref:Uncharacterized protein LOC108743381 n=1 Tax=Agrilus planipennis TaxID=224129 RepID=A0A1W4XPW2_AGRPL|nr:uncharacterized protein LOC108743381 [Agrilus planipennis]
MLSSYMFTFLFLTSIVEGSFFDENYKVNVTSDSPVVVGGTVRFTAKLYDSGGNPVTGSFLFEWEDNGIPQNIASHETKSQTDSWNVTYNSKYYPAGTYEAQVIVKKRIFFMYEVVTSERIYFQLTKNLNGKLKVTQDNREVDGIYLASNKSILFEIALKDSDVEYLHNSSTCVLTYWLIDCQYLGPSKGYFYSLNFTVPEKHHSVEVLIIASFDPTGCSNTALETIQNTSSITPSLLNINKSNVLITSAANVEINTKTSMPLVSEHMAFNIPYVCQNTSIAPDDTKAYGYFKRTFTVKAGVSNVTVTGNNWLQHGDILSLNIKCTGSGMFNYCVHYSKAPYNITGNETCLSPDTSEKCEFSIRHYFKSPEMYTAIIVIFNDVGKIISPVTITVYKVNKQAQLSVIIVPVIFSIIAIVLVIFGIAYYLQNRSRFIVEVADFNFGRQYADMEYKTFTERLKESISNALIRTPSPSPSEHSVWPPGQKYGSLT